MDKPSPDKPTSSGSPVDSSDPFAALNPQSGTSAPGDNRPRPTIRERSARFWITGILLLSVIGATFAIVYRTVHNAELNAERDRFTEARRIGTRSTYESFLAQYPNGSHATAARTAIQFRRSVRSSRDLIMHYFDDFRYRGGLNELRAPSGAMLLLHHGTLRALGSEKTADDREAEVTAKARAAATLLDPIMAANLELLGERMHTSRYIDIWFEHREQVTAALDQFDHAVNILDPVPDGGSQ